MNKVKPFVAFGNGYSDEFKTFAQARAAVKTNKNGAVYVLACSCGDNEGCSWCNGNHTSKVSTETTRVLRKTGSKYRFTGEG